MCAVSEPVKERTVRGELDDVQRCDGTAEPVAKAPDVDVEEAAEGDPDRRLVGDEQHLPRVV